MEKASSLQERLHGPFKPGMDANPSGYALWEKWKTIAANNNEEIFQKRLKLWRLDPSKAHALLRTHYQNLENRVTDKLELCPWVKTFQEFIENLAEVLASPLVLKHPLPFEELLKPFLQEAKRRLQQRFPHESPQVVDAFVFLLADGWSTLFTPSLYLEFSIFRLQHLTPLEMLVMQPEDHPTECYDLFITSFDQKRWKTFFLEYCVLARLMVQKFEAWLAVAQEFLQRYQQDKTAIEKVFFASERATLVDIQGNLSDPHSCGRTVFLLKFTDDNRVIYKPRDLHKEVLFDQFSTRCTEGDSSLLDLKNPIRLLRQGYGWEEYIEQKSCQSRQEGKEFFQRAGQLLALVYVLSGRDFHHENLIAHGAYPVLIDLEMLFDVPHGSQEVQNAHSELTERLGGSVIQTGLLPSWQFFQGEYYSSGGLGTNTCVQGLEWKYLNSDLMKKETYQKNLPAQNIPLLGDIALKLEDHQTELEEGFCKMYTFLQNKKEMLLQPDHLYQQFKQYHKRLVFRSTMLYDHFLQKACKPEYLRCGIENSFVFEELFVLLKDYSKENLENFSQELEQLEKRDVPFFQKSIAASSNDSDVPSGFEQSSHIIKALGQKDLDFQLSLIDTTLELSSVQTPFKGNFTAKSALPKPFMMPSSTLWLEETLRIKDILVNSAHVGKDGSLCWYTIRPESFSENKRSLSVLDFDLYGGSLGVALFFSALAYTIQDASLHQMALKTMKPALDNLETTLSAKIAFGLDGLGAYFYTLATVGRQSNEPDLHKKAQKMVERLSKRNLTTDSSYDIMSGTSSCLLGLLAIHDLIGGHESLEKAVICGDHLLNQRELAPSGQRTWKCSGALMTGFSHGAAGIAYALLRLFARTGEKRFWEAAHEAIEYERAVFLKEEGNWPDLRPKRAAQTMTSWCHGAPGIGLGRVGALSIFQDEKVFEEIEIASQTTMQYGYQSDDRLCCGDCGRVEYLLTAGLRLNRPELVQKAMEYAALMAKGGKENRDKLKHSSFINPGLFLGLSGVGYTFLRCAVGDKVPNILLLESNIQRLTFS